MKLRNKRKNNVVYYLSLTAWLPRLDTLIELNPCEEEDEEEEEREGDEVEEEGGEDEESVLHNDSWDSGRKPSFRYSTSSYSHNAGPSYLHTSPSKFHQTFSENGFYRKQELALC